jgi:hypothetical protein
MQDSTAIESRSRVQIPPLKTAAAQSERIEKTISKEPNFVSKQPTQPRARAPVELMHRIVKVPLDVRYKSLKNSAVLAMRSELESVTFERVGERTSKPPASCALFWRSVTNSEQNSDWAATAPPMWPLQVWKWQLKSVRGTELWIAPPSSWELPIRRNVESEISTGSEE